MLRVGRGLEQTVAKIQVGEGYAICLCDGALQEVEAEAVKGGLIW